MDDQAEQGAAVGGHEHQGDHQEQEIHLENPQVEYMDLNELSAQDTQTSASMKVQHMDKEARPQVEQMTTPTSVLVMKVTTTGEADLKFKQKMATNFDTGKDECKTNTISGAGGQSSRTRFQAMLAGQLPEHQPKVDKQSRPVKGDTIMVDNGQNDKILTRTGGEKVDELRMVFEPGVSRGGCTTQLEKQVDNLSQKEANMVGERKFAKAGRSAGSRKKSGLVQARIEGFLNLSGKEVVEKGRLPKRKRVMVVGDKLDSTKKKLKK